MTSSLFIHTVILTFALTATCAFTFQSVPRVTNQSIRRSSSLAIFPELVGQLGQEGLVSIGQEAAGLGSIGLEGLDLAFALASAAAAGAAAQLPRISDLEEDKNLLNAELDEAKVNLIATREEWAAKVDQFEDNLFQMDKEFEEQTVVIKNEFDRTMQLELEQLTFKVKEKYAKKASELEEQYERDLSMKLAVQDAKTKQNFLLQKISFISTNEEASRKKLSKILHNQAKIAALNRDLEDTLMEVQKELDAYKAKRSLVDFLLGRRK